MTRKNIFKDHTTGNVVWRIVTAEDRELARQARLQRIQEDWISKEDFHATLLDVQHKNAIEERQRIQEAVKSAVAKEARSRAMCEKPPRVKKEVPKRAAPPKPKVVQNQKQLQRAQEARRLAYERGHDTGLERAAKALEDIVMTKEDRDFIKALASMIRAHKIKLPQKKVGQPGSPNVVGAA